MKLLPFRPDDQYFEDLVAKFEKDCINLDYRDVLAIRQCKVISAYEAIKDSSFSCNVDEFVGTFLKEVKKQIQGQSVNHVLVCIIPDSEKSILMETLSLLYDFMEIFEEKTEVHWGLGQNEVGVPMRLIAVIGKDS